jgi:hypothetical protein
MNITNGELRELIGLVRGRATTPGHATTLAPSESRPFRSLSEEDIGRAEAQLGFMLPAIVRHLFVEVGNGGFGPGYGILPLVATDDVPQGRFITEMYQRFCAADARGGKKWSRVALPFNSWGSGILSVLALTEGLQDADPEVYRFEPNMPEAWTSNYLKGYPHIGTGLIPEQRSLSQWLREWLDGRAAEMFQRMNQI